MSDSRPRRRHSGAPASNTRTRGVARVSVLANESFTQPGDPPGGVLSVAEATALATSENGRAVVISADARAATELLENLTSHERHRALTLLVPEPGATADHPHLRLLRALADGKRAWEGVFDAIVDPLMLLDGKGVLQRANLGMARALSFPVAKAPAKFYLELLGAAQGEDPIAESLRDGQARTAEARYAGLPILWQVTASPIRGGLGHLEGLVVLLKDLGAPRRERELLQQASRLADIGQLAAGIAHEINTPLASIALRAESLLRAANDPELAAHDSFRNFQRYLTTILDETFRCKRIIGALLEFSARRPPERRATDVNSLVERATDLVGHQFQIKHVNLSLDLEQPIESIHADAGQLRQVLLALLMNALDATSSGGSVKVGTRRATDGVALTVTDSGMGMAPDVLEKVFAPFFTTKPLGQGTGLGLSICHGIVTSHGGQIAISSQPEQGTCVTIQLPAGTMESKSA